MANERLYQFPSKAAPVPADIIFAGDSAAAFNEVQITIAALIAAYPNLSGIGGLTLGANTYPYSNNSAVITAGTITALGVSLLADSTIATMQTTLGNQATPIASRFAGWDANKNLAANNFLSGYTTIATAGATTTLTVASTAQQFFTGSTTQTVLLPVTSTLVLGQQFYIINNSSGAVTVQSSGGNNIQVMAANTTLFVTCILTSGTTAASWYADYNFQTALVLPVSLANGGTNAALTAVSGGIVYSTASALAISAAGTSGQLFQSAGAGAPGWTTSTYPATNAINTLLYASSANVMAALATVTSGVLTTVAGVPTWNTTGLPVALGGTGVTSVTTVPAATAFAGWDANKNLSANNLINGYTTTATAAATTTLTVASTNQQYFTGSTTQTVVLPVTSTLVLGQQFYIVNNSSGVVTVQSSGANNIVAMAANTAALLTCILTSGTTAASWNSDYEESGLVIPVSLANGGTGAALSSVNSAVFSTTSGGASQLSATLPTGLTIPLPLISGVINGGNASAGNVGEVISSTILYASRVTLTNATATDVTSISLTAGDWDVWGNVYFEQDSVAITQAVCWTSLTSATTPNQALYAGAIQLAASGVNPVAVVAPYLRVSVSTTTTVYLSALSQASAGTTKGCGQIYARRAR